MDVMKYRVHFSFGRTLEQKGADSGEITLPIIKINQ